MTKQEVWIALPDTIEHPASGYGVLELISDTNKNKGLCYRHRNKTTSYGSYGQTWSEVFVKMKKNLEEDGISLD